MIISILQCCKSRLRPIAGVTKFVQSRSCTMMKTSEKMELLLKKRDHIPLSYELVYRQKNYVFQHIMYYSVNIIAFISLSGGIYFGYQLYKDPKYFISEDFEENPEQLLAFMVVNVFMLFAANLLRSRWPLRIYRDPNKGGYRAVFISRVPFHLEYYEFPAKSLSYKSKESKLPWNSVTFKIENQKRKIILFDNLFRNHNDFYQMLRSDQLDF
ncbi:uncharacterized protein LOC106642628 [Copidosoma floridanum]|uniref:uncharacterized protein LOC106642628 n=1 Tax=Copidosoma floridanum TaxID=29053 RepID=UPI0006C9B091|nr:uncharacterized protein LOC106642628 [Copidosoma floridanum]